MDIILILCLRPKSYIMSQITYEQRYTISTMLADGYSVAEIAKCIKKDKSTIYRERSRNSDKRSGSYGYVLAERKCRKRHKEKRKLIRFTPEIEEKTESLLREDYSPEQIVGYCKKNEINIVSAERIYQHIWKNKKQDGDLHKHLRRQGRRYRKRGSSKDSRGIIKNRISIEKRPEIVNKRERFGDLEVDLIIGEHHQNAILTINDRASGVLKMKKVSTKEASVVSKAIRDLLEDWIPYLHTITSDNGKEFSEHQKVAECLNVDYYFAHPYHSWERGSNENLNGLVRQYFKKGSSFSSITNEQIKEVEEKLNNRPRKRFNYETPIFVMNQLLFNPKVAFIT